MLYKDKFKLSLNNNKEKNAIPHNTNLSCSQYADKARQTAHKNFNCAANGKCNFDRMLRNKIIKALFGTNEFSLILMEIKGFLVQSLCSEQALKY